MKADDFNKLTREPEELRYILFEISKVPNWTTDVKKGDLVLYGGWFNVLTLEGMHIAIQPSYLKLKGNIMLPNTGDASVITFTAKEKLAKGDWVKKEKVN